MPNTGQAFRRFRSQRPALHGKAAEDVTFLFPIPRPLDVFHQLGTSPLNKSFARLTGPPFHWLHGEQNG